MSPAAAAPLPIRQRKCTCDWARDGLYLRLASGAGYARFSGDGPSGSTSIAGAGYTTSIAVGGSLRRGLVLAGTLQAVEATETFNGGPYGGAQLTVNGNSVAATRKADASLAQLGALVDWYPLEQAGLHLGLSAGLSVVSVVNRADDSSWHGSGVGGSLFVGYDWPIASTLAVGVSLVASDGTTVSLKNDDSNDTGYKLRPLSIGVVGSLLYF